MTRLTATTADTFIMQLIFTSALGRTNFILNI